MAISCIIDHHRQQLPCPSPGRREDDIHYHTLTGSLPRLLVTVYCLISAAAVTADDHREMHEYTISVDYALSRLWVEARFASPVSSISARSKDAGRYLVDVRGCGEDPAIRMRNRRMMLPQQGINCINYTIDLAKAAKHERDYRDLSDKNIIVSPSLWLWRPELTNRSNIRAIFRLPQDVRVSVPWQPVDGQRHTYQLGRSPESSNALVVFGSFDYREVKVPGAVLRVALLDRDTTVNGDELMHWVAAAATDVSLAYGRYPNPNPQVVIIPVAGRDNSAVPFGRVIRDGGETVQLFVNPERPMSEIMQDWTATHEFSHLMLPYLNARHRWVSEGFAQYYQNVLLARSGTYDSQHAWQKLYEGFERGRKSRPELSPNEAAEGGIRAGLMKIYWSGAAIALMADVELRERSAGRESLDTVLGRFQECCLPGDRVWSGRELFAKLDTLIDEPLFIPLYRRYADTAGFPNTKALFARLGLEIDDGQVRIRRKAELIDIRAAITRPDADTRYRAEQVAARE